MRNSSRVQTELIVETPWECALRTAHSATLGNTASLKGTPRSPTTVIQVMINTLVDNKHIPSYLPLVTLVDNKHIPSYLPLVTLVDNKHISCCLPLVTLVDNKHIPSYLPLVTLVDNKHILCCLPLVTLVDNKHIPLFTIGDFS